MRINIIYKRNKYKTSGTIIICYIHTSTTKTLYALLERQFICCGILTPHFRTTRIGNYQRALCIYLVLTFLGRKIWLNMVKFSTNIRKVYVFARQTYLFC